jgi:formate-nitrite transporter family protein
VRSAEEERDRQAEPDSKLPPALVRAPIAPEPEPPEIEAALEDKAARKEQRSPLQVMLSGLIGGLDIGFSPLGLAFVATHLAPAVGADVAGLFGALAFPIGFIFVILGRSQLFTESTLTPALGVMSGASTLGRLARQWGLVLGSNLVGAFMFAFFIAHSGPLAKDYGPVLVRSTQHLLSFDFVAALLSALLAGWVMAVLSWLLAAADSTLARITFVYLATFLIGAAPLHHSISGATEVLTTVMLGRATWGDWFWRFQVPATLGNAIGGVVLVAALRYLLAGRPGRPRPLAEQNEL